MNQVFLVSSSPPFLTNSVSDPPTSESPSAEPEDHFSSILPPPSFSDLAGDLTDSATDFFRAAVAAGDGAPSVGMVDGGISGVVPLASEGTNSLHQLYGFPLAD